MHSTSLLKSKQEGLCMCMDGEHGQINDHPEIGDMSFYVSLTYAVVGGLTCWALVYWLMM